jgi:hypothetical protein
VPEFLIITLTAANGLPSRSEITVPVTFFTWAQVVADSRREVIKIPIFKEENFISKEFKK